MITISLIHHWYITVSLLANIVDIIYYPVNCTWSSSFPLGVCFLFTIAQRTARVFPASKDCPSTLGCQVLKIKAFPHFIFKNRFIIWVKSQHPDISFPDPHLFQVNRLILQHFAYWKAQIPQSANQQGFGRDTLRHPSKIGSDLSQLVQFVAIESCCFAYYIYIYIYVDYLYIDIPYNIYIYQIYKYYAT